MKRLAMVIGAAAVLAFLGSYHVAEVEACCGAYYPPTINELSCDPDQLWPPNHKYRDIMVTANVTADPRDPSNPPVDWQVVSVSSNQPDNATGVGDGNTTNDCYVQTAYTTDPVSGQGFGMVRARAERCGNTAAQYGMGRTYTIVVRAWARGLFQTFVAERSCQVYVPHDRGR